MKQLIILIVLLTGALCNVSAQDRLHPTHTSTTKSDEIKSFITQMYNNKLYEDYDFLQKHCSAELLKKLQDAYPYDTDGIAYATWLFRSSQQDSKPGSDDKTIMLEVKADGGDWFVYTALDMGWEFTNRIKITNNEVWLYTKIFSMFQPTIAKNKIIIFFKKRSDIFIIFYIGTTDNNTSFHSITYTRKLLLIIQQQIKRE